MKRNRSHLVVAALLLGALRWTFAAPAEAGTARDSGASGQSVHDGTGTSMGDNQAGAALVIVAGSGYFDTRMVSNGVAVHGLVSMEQ